MRSATCSIQTSGADQTTQRRFVDFVWTIERDQLVGDLVFSQPGFGCGHDLRREELIARAEYESESRRPEPREIEVGWDFSTPDNQTIDTRGAERCPAAHRRTALRESERGNFRPRAHHGLGERVEIAHVVRDLMQSIFARHPA